MLESCARVILSTFHQFSLIFNFLLLLPRFGETENCLLMVLICLFSLCTKLAIRAGRLFVFLRRGQKWSRKREEKEQSSKIESCQLAARAVSFYFIFYWMYLNLRGDVTLDKRDDGSLTRTFESPRESSHHAVIESGFDLSLEKRVKWKLCDLAELFFLLLVLISLNAKSTSWAVYFYFFGALTNSI